MKKILTLIKIGLCLLPAVFLFNGCKKNNPGSPYYMQFKANGTLITFNAPSSETVGFAGSGTQYTCTLSGFDATSNFSIVISDTDGVTTGPYSGYALGSKGGIHFVTFTYQDNSGNVYDGSSISVNDSVNITGIGTTVTGNFSGVVNKSGKPAVSITDGQFVIQKTL